MPRVGNVAYAEAVEDGYEANDVSAMRFRNGDDFVTQVPWRWLGYHHTGHFMHLAGEGTFDFNAADQDPGDTSESIGTFADHYIDEGYYPWIREHLDSPDYADLSRSCPPAE